MIKYYFSLITLLLLLQPLCAQRRSPFYGFAEDARIHIPIPGVLVSLMRPDSTLVDSVRTESGTRNYIEIAQFFFQKGTEGKYILRFEKEGYETLYSNLDLKFYMNEPSRFVGKHYMKKNEDIKLKGATVKATKVKIYSKGDTIVYNADAFQLSEGSMLDALIRQLPGAELKDDGQILVNGRLVESLLLNGKDFFKKDRSVMLDNLPSYMVRDIKVYEKAGDKGEFLKEDVGDNSFVMDVNLKKQYSIGWIMNAHAAKGSENRYFTNAFALRFTPNSRIALFGTANNMNDTRKPGENSDWTPSDMAGGGINTIKKAGIDYMVDFKEKHLRIEGSAVMEHIDEAKDGHSNRINFLTGGDTYGRSKTSTYSCNTNFNTNHHLKMAWSNAQLHFYPSFYYTKYDNTSSVLNGTFSEDPSKYASKGILDSLFSPNSGNLLRKIAIYRNKDAYYADGNYMSGNMSMNSSIMMPNGKDYLHINANVFYDKRNEKFFRHYLLEYPNDESSTPDFRNQYNWTPSRSHSYDVKAEYNYRIKEITLAPFYGYKYSYNSNNRSLYRLDKYDNWNSNTEHSLGDLPSTNDSIQEAIDAKNSYYSKSFNNTQNTGLNIFMNKKLNNDKAINLFIYLPLAIEHNKMKYQRNAIDTTFSRNNVFFNPTVNVTYYTKNKQNIYEFRYKANTSAPNMLYSLGEQLRDDVDPLYISVGNSNLKNKTSHDVYFSYSNNISEKQRFLNVNASYVISQNSVAMGYVYNKQTGVRTTTPDNVNGNWGANSNINYTIPIDKAKRLALSTNTNSQFYNNVDLITVEGLEGTARSTVKSFYLTETVRLDYRRKTFKVGTKLTGTWVNATSRREDFTTVNAADFNYGLTAQIEMPWSMQLSTDITVYSRRGYEDKTMNTDDFVWNARLSKRAMKGHLTFILDGFDILGNLSNVTRTLNAQGKTETYRDVIPSYIMLHAIYSFDIKPKKRQGEM